MIYIYITKEFTLLLIFQFGTGSCSGDSGGPLVFYDKSNKPHRHVQVGIVQGSAGECGNDRFPGIYARLDNYDVLNFIRKTAFGESISLPSPSSLGNHINELDILWVESKMLSSLNKAATINC